MLEPILLTDEQIREFIVNGYLVFEPTVPKARTRRAMDGSMRSLTPRQIPVIISCRACLRCATF